jgi:hypothetical protein
VRSTFGEIKFFIRDLCFQMKRVRERQSEDKSNLVEEKSFK